MSGKESGSYLPSGLPIPVPEPDGLSAPYWSGLRHSRLLVQRCTHCRTWQFGPEWLCHHCHAFEMEWTEVEPRGRIFSWERVWHPSHATLKQHGPYLAALVELPHAGGVRMVGNLLGDAMQAVAIGAEVEGTFEHHQDSAPPYRHADRVVRPYAAVHEFDGLAGCMRVSCTSALPPSHRAIAYHDRAGAPAHVERRLCNGYHRDKLAKAEIAMIKVAVPNVACQIVDWAIQAHGGGGTSNDFGLAGCLRNRAPAAAGRRTRGPS